MPAKIQSFRFESWSEFKTSFQLRLPGRGSGMSLLGRYVFRGQEDKDWELVTSFDRQFEKRSLRTRNKEFKKWMRRFHEEISREYRHDYTDSDVRLIALAQHYGLPTRFLDWTRSPYVAAYFALFHKIINRNAQNEVDAVVWVLNLEMLQRSVRKTELEIVSVTDVENRRMKNQDGVFTLQKTDDYSLDSFLIKKGGQAANSIAKLIIPGREAKIAIQDLFLMGISHKTAFPGHDGIADYIVMRSRYEE